MTPNLFIVGFQKCGSSTLFQLLSEFDNISVSTPKETYALTDSDFALHNPDKNVLNPKFDWRSCFENKEAKYFLEASVCNFYQKTALNYISKLKDKKVIFIVRNPVDRFISTFNYFGNRIENLGPIPTLDHYFSIIKDKNKEVNVQGAKYAIDHGHYSKYIDRWKKEIGAENVKVVGLKNLVKQPEITLNSICDFLDLKKSKNIDLAHANKTENIKNRHLNYYARKLFGGTGLGKTFLGEWYKKLNTTSKKPSINKELKSKLMNIYSREFKLFKEYF